MLPSSVFRSEMNDMTGIGSSVGGSSGGVAMVGVASSVVATTGAADEPTTATTHDEAAQTTPTTMPDTKKAPPASPPSESETEAGLSAYGDEDASGVHNAATLLMSDKKCNGATRKKVSAYCTDIVQ